MLLEHSRIILLAPTGAGRTPAVLFCARTGSRRRCGSAVQLRTICEHITIRIETPAQGTQPGASDAIRCVMHGDSMAEQGKTSASKRRSAVVHGRLAMRDAVLEAARNRAHGLQAMAFEQLAARLAGGLLRAIDDESLRAGVQAALPGTQLANSMRSRACPALSARRPTRCARHGGPASTSIVGRSQTEGPGLESGGKSQAARKGNISPFADKVLRSRESSGAYPPRPH